MRLKGLGEFGAIRRIQALCSKPGRAVRVGIGDDAAAYRPGAGLELVTSDMMVEGVHFEPGLSGWRDIGYKALMSNMSDIAAMGGRPRYYLVSAAFRGDEDERSLEGLYSGFEAAAKPFGVRLIGGDTTGTPGPRVVSVTVLGEACPKGPVTRSGARPGDDIYVTGTLGDSAAGLELLRAGADGRGSNAALPLTLPLRGGREVRMDRVGVKSRAGEYDEEYLVSRHLRPDARVAAGFALGASGLATSMIDVSDGFSSDLGHILEQSGAGAKICAERLPLSEALVGYAGPRRAVMLALHGGEDYELVFTARPRARKKIAGMFGRLGVGAGMVGEITKEKGAYLVTGRGAVKKLRPGGYEHFRR